MKLWICLAALLLSACNDPAIRHPSQVGTVGDPGCDTKADYSEHKDSTQLGGERTVEKLPCKVSDGPTNSVPVSTIK